MVGKYRLEVSYSGVRDLDRDIRMLVGKNDWASGAGFGFRDLSFDFRSKRERDRAKARLVKAGLARVTISAHDD